MNVSLDYKYYLTNVNWTNKYENVLCLGTKAARDTYFDLVNVFNNITDTHNFNISNLFKTTIVVDGANYLQVLQKNYIIICKYDEDNSANNEYFFYFITNARQCNSNRIELTIELDVYQQYYYDVTFPDCPINRCKVPVNTEVSASFYYSGTNANGSACNSEPIDYPLCYKKKYDINDDNIANANHFSRLSDFVNGFMYVFVDPSHTFEMKDFEATPGQVAHEISGYATMPEGQYGVYNNIGVLCFPIYNSSRKIRLKYGADYYTLQDGNDALRSLMGGNAGADAAHIYSVKISRRPPFSNNFIEENSVNTNTSYYTITCDANLDPNNDILYLKEPTTNYYYTGIIRTMDTYNCIRLLVDSNEYYTYDYIVPFTDFNSIKYAADPNGKLQAPQYTKVYFDFGDGNKMEFDLGKARKTVDNTHIKLNYKEAIVPDITRYTVCIDAPYYSGDGNGIDVNNQTFTSDMSMIFTLDQWASFLANNKNFYAQGNFNAVMNINKKTLSGINQASSMNFIGAGATVASMYADTLQFTTNREYQVDNLKDSVDRVVNQNGSALFNLIVKGIHPSIVVYQLESNKVSNVVMYLKMFGFNTKGLYGNIKTIMDNNVSGYYDYHYAFIQASVEDIKTGDMSLECEMRFLQIFKDGVRFWYEPTKMYDYTY